MNGLNCKTDESRAAHAVDSYILRSGSGYLLKPFRSQLIARALRKMQAQREVQFVEVQLDEAPAALNPDARFVSFDSDDIPGCQLYTAEESEILAQHDARTVRAFAFMKQMKPDMTTAQFNFYLDQMKAKTP